jgi:hypothetical protein
VLTVEVPDWLKARDGDLRLSKDGHTLWVYFAGDPHYLVEPLPACGQFAARVTQTENGKRVDAKGPFPTRDAAFRGGLDELRRWLGW